jgi:hypothetical protein
MVQPAARTERQIKGRLVQILIHRMKILLAGPVDAKYRTQCQASRDHWNKEIEQFWKQLVELNQTPSRRTRQFFGDDQLQQWQESEELIEDAMAEAIKAYEKYLKQRGLEPDRRWLRSTLKELYYEHESD